MKHLLLFLLTLNILFANEYAVQVVAVKNSDSITPYLKNMASKLQSDDIKLKVIDERSKGYEKPLKKMLFEKFSSKKSAMKFCKVAREKLFEDAFVRTASSDDKVILKNNTSILKKIEPETTVHIKTTPMKMDPMQKYVSEREKRKIRREKEIALAIAYYKNESCLKFACPKDSF